MKLKWFIYVARNRLAQIPKHNKMYRKVSYREYYVCVAAVLYFRRGCARRYVPLLDVILTGVGLWQEQQIGICRNNGKFLRMTEYSRLLHWICSMGAGASWRAALLAALGFLPWRVVMASAELWMAITENCPNSCKVGKSHNLRTNNGNYLQMSNNNLVKAILA